MYSDLYGVFQLYMNTALNTPLTDREHHYTQPRWSPDGAHIAYTVSALTDTSPLRVPDGLVGSVIEIIDADGSNRRILTDGSGEYAPAWSPDGKSIAFASLADGAIYLIDVDGSNRRLIRDGLTVRSLAFSPDGERLLVTVREEDGIARVYLLSIDGGMMRPLLADNRSAWDAVWSPDGSTIACATDDGILLTGDEGLTARVLTFTGYWTFALEDRFFLDGPTWSPDGRRLAFTIESWRLQIAVSTPVPFERIGSQLAVVDIATGEVELLTYGFTNADPDWRP